MDDESTRKAQGKRLAEARKAAGYRSARDAALENSWKESSYRAHETGGRTIGLDDAERYARRYRSEGVKISARQILFGDDEPGFSEESEPHDAGRMTIPVMGRIGAGARIMPDFEQAPPDGLYQVELPFYLGDNVIGFEVEGDSMLPKFADGAIVAVFKEQTRSTSSMIGELAAVKTSDGHRYLKLIMPGARQHLYNLQSFNASTKPIIGVKIDWASDIIASIEPRHVRHIGRTKPSKRGTAK